MTYCWKKAALAVGAAVALSGIGAGAHSVPVSASEEAAGNGVRITRYLGLQTLPHKMEFEGTVVGGFSGMDRDPLTGIWYFLSDDRWRYNPARFYTGRLDIDPVTGDFGGVEVTGVETLLDENGEPYPGFGKQRSVDPESIRFDRWSRQLLWAQEGDRPDAGHPDVPLAQQSLRWATKSGRHLGEVRLPDNLKLTETDSGTRRNTGIEALTFTATGIVAANEDPRYEDGPLPTVDEGATTRITVWDRLHRVKAQYAYEIDALPAAPIPPGGITDSGVSEILAVDGGRFLVLERSWIEGVDYRTKLYEIDLRGATDVLDRDSLADGEGYTAVSKRLVHDFGDSDRPQQNLEAMAWGPRLRTGECTLVVAADDNFDSREVAEFHAFAVRGC
ncbi:esterase-like activity of phytase family protein [Phytomonospora sp. NPDC050363]|uniref:esterase-like activity of phytase family protein n=1 Tax=Phytomonospora sp. NPDC050363 TaxID=3155642 RepID=UPI0034064D50